MRFKNGISPHSTFGVWGHTELVYVSEPGNYKIVGETRDDAVGEAYDKVGRVMGFDLPSWAVKLMNWLIKGKMFMIFHVL